MTHNDATSRTRLAQALTALRPEWPTTSLQTLLANPALRNRAFADVTIAAMRLAVDPEVRTPGQLLRPGKWWTDTNPGPDTTDKRPTPPPISQIQLGVTNPADPTPYLTAIRRTLKENRDNARTQNPPEQT